MVLGLIEGQQQRRRSSLTQRVICISQSTVIHFTSPPRPFLASPFLASAINCFSSSVIGAIILSSLMMSRQDPDLSQTPTNAFVAILGEAPILINCSSMRIIGLTGGICCGKSTASKLLRERGIKVIDADLLGHKTYEQGTDCYKQLREAFGERIISSSGDIDRRQLGSLVFGNDALMQQLRDIVWPEIRKLIIAELRALEESGEKTVALEAAVMVEAKWYDLVDELWVITADPEVAKQRLMQRNHLSEGEAMQRMTSQISSEDRQRHASLVIANSGDEEGFRSEVTQHVDHLLMKAHT